MNIQRLFGSQRALKIVEDFTEFEQRAAYFDGDPVIADQEGRQHPRARQPGPLHGRVPGAARLPAGAEARRRSASSTRRRRREAELRGQELFFGKAQCADCHPAPYYTDNLMHNLQAERFFKPQMINGRMAAADGPIKTFPLRGIKDSPPYLHDGRLLTLEDTVEFFNLVLETKLTERGEEGPGGVPAGTVGAVPGVSGDSMQYETDKATIDYEENGEGRPILLLHGWTMDRRVEIFATRPGWQRI